MDSWQRLRATAFGDSFHAKLDSGQLGFGWAEFDLAWPEIEDAICGADDDLLDVVYPVIAGTDGVRWLLTEAAALPALVVVWRLVDNGERVMYLDLALR